MRRWGSKSGINGDNRGFGIKTGDELGPKACSIILSYVGEVPMAGLREYLHKGGKEWPIEAVSPLGVVMRLKPNINYVPCGRGFAFPPDDKVKRLDLNLGRGSHSWRAFIRL